MQYSYKKQRGLTLISMVFILGLIAFFTLLVLRIGPIYMDHSKVVHALETLKNRPEIEKRSKREVWTALDKQFGMNYVYHVTQKDVKIITRGNYVKVQIKYHVKQPMFANLSVWVDFDDSIEVGMR